MSRKWGIVLALFAASCAGCARPHAHLSFAIEQRILSETTLHDMPLGKAGANDAAVRVYRTGKESGACSGAVIGRRHVLTAAHCVVHAKGQREVIEVEISPSDVHIELGGDYLPWGRVGVNGIYRCPGHDLVVLRLTHPVPDDLRILGLRYEPPSLLDRVTVFGFGVAEPGRSIWNWGPISSTTRHRYDGPVTFSGPTMLDIGVLAVPGDSGSPILDPRSGSIIGVLTNGASANALDWDERRSLFASGTARGTQLAACRETIDAALAE